MQIGERIGLWTPVLAAVTLAAAVHAAQPAALRIVQDPGNRFTIGIPDDWIVETSPRDRALTARSPATPGQLSNTIDVITRDLLRAITPENCAWQAAQVMRFTIHHWTTLEEGPGTLAGFRAYSRQYTWRTGTGQERRSIQTCVTPGRRAFVIVGTTNNSPKGILRDLPELERIISTFRPNLSTDPGAGGSSDRER